MKRKSEMNELLMAQLKLQSEQIRLWSEGMSFLITTKNSLMDDFRFNRQMGIPMDEEKLLNRINELREKIAEVSGLRNPDWTNGTQLLSWKCTSGQDNHS